LKESCETELKLYFNDITSFQLRWFEKLMIYYNISYFNNDNAIFSKQNSLDLLKFIKVNKYIDFVINCEYGRSRSVAIGLFIKEIYNIKIINKKKKSVEVLMIGFICY
jgi:predicted protein tyrosine phosphatase